jgi:hypothetical protein
MGLRRSLAFVRGTGTRRNSRKTQWSVLSAWSSIAPEVELAYQCFGNQPSHSGTTPVRRLWHFPKCHNRQGPAVLFGCIILCYSERALDHFLCGHRRQRLRVDLESGQRLRTALSIALLPQRAMNARKPRWLLWLDGPSLDRSRRAAAALMLPASLEKPSNADTKNPWCSGTSAFPGQMAQPTESRLTRRAAISLCAQANSSA